MMIASHVRKLAGYVPGEQPRSHNVVKLNTNENAYPPSPKCAEALRAFDLDNLRRYCDPDCTELRQAIAELNGTVPERVFIGNGSDEILSLMARTFVEDDESIGSLDPSYSLYKTLAAIRNVKWIGADGGSPDREALARERVSLYIWTNPNAPTGEWTEPAAVAAFAASFPGVLLVDEAYADFARGNCMALATAADNRNLLVMRTFSKSFSLAGLRVGYCIGPAELIEALVKMKDSYNVDAIAQAVALAAVKDIGWMRANVGKIVATRRWFTGELVRRGWDVLPSESNFVFARPPAGTAAADVFAALRGREIFVRYFTGPRTGDRLRITIGTPAQMETLLAALDAMKQ